jgi:hypothetical protein
VDGATLSLSDHAKAAHLPGTTTADSEVPGVSVTVDVTC